MIQFRRICKERKILVVKSVHSEVCELFFTGALFVGRGVVAEFFQCCGVLNVSTLRQTKLHAPTFY